LSGPNSNEDSEGWVAYFQIPFTTLDLGGPPPPDAEWGLALTVHDRDDPDGLIRQNTNWPGSLDPNSPSTWGQLSFSTSVFGPPEAIRTGELLIRNGLNGNTVVDAAVGGHTTCGNVGEDKWNLWGKWNYAGFTQMNIQNQWDVADWPCFSKFYITFPLEALPPGQAILSASLSMDLFGTAGGGQWGDPPDSYIQALTVAEDWNEATLTWNNAPPASESLSGTWVYPTPGTYHWDVSRAVHQAYATGEPLRLVMYSIDGEMHSGKYFYTSDSTDWGGEIRPTLRIEYGIPCDSPNLTCSWLYLPITFQK
jgi:hypothetical protein